MLAQAQRLRQTAEIEQVYLNGRRSFHPLVRIIAANGLTKQSRVAVITSLRVSKKAVERNRLKRRLRSIIQPWLKQMPKPYDCLIIAQSKANAASYQELAQAVEQSLKKLRLIVT